MEAAFEQYLQDSFAVDVFDEEAVPEASSQA
jgi:hypothetical protein